MKTERVAIANRLLFAYPFVRPESEQNSSHLQIDCAGSLAIVTLCSVTASFMTCYLRKTTEAPAISTRPGLPTYRAWCVPQFASCTRVRASWGLTPKSWQSHNICVTEMPSNAVAVLLRSGRDQPSFRSGGHPAVKPTAPLSRHYPHNARDSGSSLGAAPWSKFAL
jgi:hypothetical protein